MTWILLLVMRLFFVAFNHSYSRKFSGAIKLAPLLFWFERVYGGILLYGAEQNIFSTYIDINTMCFF